MAPLINLEEHVVRWGEIAKRKSPFRPRDMQLPRFERERYVVLGRPHEATPGGPRTIENDHFTMVCITAEPGKGFASHAHSTVESFIVLSGHFRCTSGDQSVEVGPWDVVHVPPDLFHDLVNIGSETGVVMAINAGKHGAPITLDPKVLKELEAIGRKPESAVELPPHAPGKGGC